MRYSLLLNPETMGIDSVLSYAEGVDRVYGTLEHDNVEPRMPLFFADFDEAGAAARDITQAALAVGILPTIAIFGYEADDVPVKTWMGKLCVEASINSREFYIPCGRPLYAIVKTRDVAAYAMCKGCASHNFANRGAVLLLTKGGQVG